MTDKKCPKCGLWSTGSALLCDCGYNFESGTVGRKAERAKRPPTITAICALGGLEALFNAPIIFSPEAQQIGSWYPPFLGISFVLQLACIIGLWKMKKWAAYTYTGFFAMWQIVALAMGAWNVKMLLVPAVVIFIALKDVSKMS